VTSRESQSKSRNISFAGTPVSGRRNELTPRSQSGNRETRSADKYF